MVKKSGISVTFVYISPQLVFIRQQSLFVILSLMRLERARQVCTAFPWHLHRHFVCLREEKNEGQHWSNVQGILGDEDDER